MFLSKCRNKIKKRLNEFSKSERLIYVIIFLWVVFGIMGIVYESNLANLGGYYASLILFVSTYLWGEHKRTSNSTSVFTKGKNSTRENLIYITVTLWIILGIFGILYGMNINNLTVYFTSLTPFVTSYIIYKTTKGADLPVFSKEYKNKVDNAIDNADTTTEVSEDGVIEDEVIEDEIIEDNKSNNNEELNFSNFDPNSDDENDIL